MGGGNVASSSDDVVLLSHDLDWMELGARCLTQQSVIAQKYTYHTNPGLSALSESYNRQNSLAFRETLVCNIGTALIICHLITTVAEFVSTSRRVVRLSRYPAG